MKISHIGISQFRSIGVTPVMLDLSKRVTVLVGQNDGGKSNVLMGLERVSRLREGERQQVNEVDYHQRNKNCSPLAHFRVQGEDGDAGPYLEFGPFTITAELGSVLAESVVSSDIETLNSHQFAVLVNAWNSAIPSSLPDPDKKHVVMQISRGLVKNTLGTIPAFHPIPQFRRIENAGTYSVDGKGIVPLLAAWQHPEIGQDHLKKKFDQIETLLCTLLNRPQAKIEVPPKQDKIIINDAPMRLPLESHGTGVHQLIILAIAVLSHDGVIFGVEEPEIHLHPLLQKRFLQFLLRETTNCYVISTHSPALIAPSDDVEVIHLKMVDGVTIPVRVETDSGSLAVLEDLGVQPSDLLQANSVIWVEGPSDRIYLKRWIEVLHPRLVEGIDYSIMFYGGKLRAHLSMEREGDIALGDFVKLLRINQRSALVMDSDRTNSKDELDKTTRRLKDECERNGVHCWVTDGREIENYLSECVVEAALQEALKEQALRISSVKLHPFSKFDEAMKRAIPIPCPAWCDYAKHKTAWAHRFAKHFCSDGSDVGAEIKKRMDEMMERLIPQAGPLV